MANKTLTYNIVGNNKSATAAMKGVAKSGSSLTKVFAGVGAAIAGAFAVKRIINFSSVAVKEFAEAEDSQNRLTDAFSRFPKIADTNITALRKLNTALQNKTKFDDDALAAAQAQLAQYNLTGKQLETLTPLVADFAAKTGKDLPTAAGILGKALLGNGKGLKSIGANFKDTGTAAGNYAELIDILTDKVGGFAEKQGGTFSGQLEILHNQFGELKERVGSVFAPALGKLADLMSTKVLPLFDRLVDKVGPKLEAFFDAGAGKIGDFLDAVSTGATTGNWGPLTDFFSKATPLLPTLAAGLAAISTALTDPATRQALFDLVTKVLPPLVDLFVALTPLIPPLAAALTTILVPALQGAASMWGALGHALDVVSGKKPVGTLLKDILTNQGPWADGVRTLFGAFISGSNFAVGALNVLIGGIENVINAIGKLTGVSIHLPRISSVKGISVGGSKPSSGLGPGESRNTPGHTGRTSGASAYTTGVAGGTNVIVNMSGISASTDRQLAQTIRTVLVNGVKNGSIPAGSFS